MYKLLYIVMLLLLHVGLTRCAVCDKQMSLTESADVHSVLHDSVSIRRDYNRRSQQSAVNVGAARDVEGVRINKTTTRIISGSHHRTRDPVVFFYTVSRLEFKSELEAAESEVIRMK